MKPLIAFFLVMLLMTVGCTTEGERIRMRSGLDSLNTLNRTDQPFTVQDVEPYVRFFDDHGTPNDRLLAHYLLGRAYYDHGEAPMALQCYHDAIDCADTTAQDCDYVQLARVYGQMAEIFWVPMESIDAGDIGAGVGFKDIRTGDTLLHLDIIIDRLKREFKVECNQGKPQVNYKEAITKTVMGYREVYKKQSGGRGKFADIIVNVGPVDDDWDIKENGGLQFVNEVKAQVPLSEMFGYVTALRTITSGRATSSMEYDHHAPLSSALAKAVLEEVKGRADLV